MTTPTIRWAFALLSTLLVVASLSVPAQAHDKSWPAKRLARTWDGADKFTSRQFALTGAQIAKIGKLGLEIGVEEKNPTLYFAQFKKDGSGEPATAGAIIFIDEYGANGLMEVSVGVNTEGAVTQLSLWEHSENKAIAADEFLEQFHGKTFSDSFEAGEGYAPAEGADKASAGVARAVHKALATIAVLYGTDTDTSGGHDDGAEHDDSDGHHDKDEGGHGHGGER
jgi:hypothetical protein